MPLDTLTVEAFNGCRDHVLTQTGKATKDKASSSSDALSIKESMATSWVWSKEAALAVWS